MTEKTYQEMINKDRTEVLSKLDKEIEQARSISKELYQRIKTEGENKELIAYYNKATERSSELQKEQERVSNKMSPDFNLGMDAKILDEANEHNYFISQKNKAAKKIEEIEVELANLYNDNKQLGIARAIPIVSIVNMLGNTKKMLAQTGTYIDIEDVKDRFDKRYAEVEKIKEERARIEKEQKELRKALAIDDDEPMDGSVPIGAYPHI